jgi:hypothetical protein
MSQNLGREFFSRFSENFNPRPTYHMIGWSGRIGFFKRVRRPMIMIGSTTPRPLDFLLLFYKILPSSVEQLVPDRVRRFGRSDDSRRRRRRRPAAKVRVLNPASFLQCSAHLQGLLVSQPPTRGTWSRRLPSDLPAWRGCRREGIWSHFEKREGGAHAWSSI